MFVPVAVTNTSISIVPSVLLNLIFGATSGTVDTPSTHSTTTISPLTYAELFTPIPTLNCFSSLFIFPTYVLSSGCCGCSCSPDDSPWSIFWFS